jgi:tetratricopeptide (TPR) repeat protein
MPAVLATLCTAAYANTFHVPFIFDDLYTVVNNPSIRRLWPVWNALSPPHAGGTTVIGRPVLNFTLAVNYALSGVTPWGYHAVNLAIHILAGLTIFGIVRQTLLQPALRERFGAAANELALATAVLWAVHPLQTESVTYLSQRAESLMGLLYLLTLYGFIRGTASPSAGPWFLFSIVACLLGMATKEVMVSAPLMVLLYDRTFVSGSFREAWRRRRSLYLALGGTWILLAYLVATAGGRGGTAGFGVKILWWQYALTQTCAITHYLRLSVWPHPLVFDYGTDVVTDMWQAAPCAVPIALLVIGTAISLWRWPVVGFVGCWFFAILAPSSSFVPVATQTVAEHRMYLPLLAIVAVTLAAAWRACRNISTRFNWPASNVRVWPETAIALTLAIALAVTTFQRNAQYRSAQSIWADVVAKRPHNARAESCLAVALVDEGKLTEAIDLFHQALRANPRYGLGHSDLGSVLQSQGRTEEAIHEYQEALQCQPDLVRPRYNLGCILASQGKFAEAIEQYQDALRLEPYASEVRNNLGIALASSGKLDEAKAQFRRAIELRPDFAEAHVNWGHALADQKRFAEAIQQYEEALRFDPTNASDHYDLAIALANSGDLIQATEQFREAARLNPDLSDVHGALAKVLEKRGLHDDAQRESVEAQRRATPAVKERPDASTTSSP